MVKVQSDMRIKALMFKFSTKTIFYVKITLLILNFAAIVEDKSLILMKLKICCENSEAGERRNV